MLGETASKPPSIIVLIVFRPRDSMQRSVYMVRLLENKISDCSHLLRNLDASPIQRNLFSLQKFAMEVFHAGFLNIRFKYSLGNGVNL